MSSLGPNAKGLIITNGDSFIFLCWHLGPTVCQGNAEMRRQSRVRPTMLSETWTRSVGYGSSRPRPDSALETQPPPPIKERNSARPTPAVPHAAGLFIAPAQNAASRKVLMPGTETAGTDQCCLLRTQYWEKHGAREARYGCFMGN